MASTALSYFTRDVASEPPTTIVIVPSGGKLPELVGREDPVFAVTEDCVEPTKGWMNREGKPLLTVCFMHSFGKCAGRTNSNPATCFQIHIKANVLNALRKHYVNPTRRFFTRTVKALLSPELRQVLCMRALKELKVQYLEYRVSDVFPSTGLLQYEATYRRWLFSDDKNADHAGAITVPQCLQFSIAGSCNCGTDCPYIHADLKKAQVRDQMLARALRDVSELTQCFPTVSIHIPASLQSGHQNFAPPDSAYATFDEGAYPQNGVSVDRNQGFAKVPIFTLVRGEDEINGRLVPLPIPTLDASTQSSENYTSGAHQQGRIPSVKHPHLISKAVSPTTKALEDAQNDGNISESKNFNGWMSSSNEGISSSNNQTGSSGSGSD